MIPVPIHLAYYRNLQIKSVINSICFRFKDQAIIYGIRCRLNGKIYIGSTNDVISRVKQHLIYLNHTNPGLQSDMSKLGIQNFTFYVFKIVDIPSGLNFVDRAAYLRKIEQGNLDMYPSHQLYNIIRSYSKNSR